MPGSEGLIMPYKDPEKKLERARQYRKEQAEAISERKKLSRALNPKSFTEEWNKYYALNKEKRSAKNKEYNARAKSKEKRSANRAKRWSNDPQFRLKSLLRTRIGHALKGRAYKLSAISLLGCSVDYAIAHIEAQFAEGMSWENQGRWHIDHIVPLAAFDLNDECDVRKSCHYTNLQPLWAKENLSKGARMQSNTTAGHADGACQVNGAVMPSATGTHRSYLPHSGVEAVGIPCL